MSHIFPALLGIVFTVVSYHAWDTCDYDSAIFLGILACVSFILAIFDGLDKVG